MIMRRRPLPYILDKWQWMARDKFATNVVMKAMLGGGWAKGGYSAQQNYYASLHNVPKTQGQKE